MRTLNLVQGSLEWHQHRANAFNASDAPAMLGVSKYKTRSQLLHERATGIYPEIDDATQRRFNDGHRFEALARPLAEKIVGDDLSNVTGSMAEYSASFDGITFDGSVWFEHKSMNEELRNILLQDRVTGADLPEEHQIQMEQQAMVCGGEKCLFMATKWGANDELIECLHCWYFPNLELRKRIGMGWIQFKKDLAAYVPAVEPIKAVAEVVKDLPVLFVSAKGEVTDSNMPKFTEAADTFLSTIKTELSTDQDFADAEAVAKKCRETAKKLVGVKDAVIAQAVSIGEAVAVIEDYQKKFDAAGLKLEKLVKSEKEQRQLSILNAVKLEYANHVAGLEVEIKPMRLAVASPNFAEAMKGKKSIKGWQDAVDDALVNGKIAADSEAKDIRAKLAWCKETSEGYGFLFNDLQSIISKPVDDFKLLVTTRIDGHKQAEAAKLEAERQRIQKEEEAKAEAKVKAEQAAEVVKEVAAPVVPVAIKAEIAKPVLVEQHDPDRPTDEKIIGVLALHFSVSENHVRGWLMNFGQKKAA